MITSTHPLLSVTQVEVSLIPAQESCQNVSQYASQKMFDSMLHKDVLQTCSPTQLGSQVT